MSDFEITQRNDRGFTQYGEPVLTAYGQKIEVYESSAASAPHCWLRIFQDGGPDDGKDMTAHLTIEQATAVRDRLTAAINDLS